MEFEQIVVFDFELKGSDFNAAAETSSKIKRILQQIGVRSDIIRRVAISSYEAEMNVIIHVHKGKMRITIYPDRTELQIEDQGPGINDIELAMTEGFSTASDYFREMGFGAGMGLSNMKRCSDKFIIHSTIAEGTKISMTIFHNAEN
ncbi:MAG: spoIIAB 1 [Firmicutes bacterium]|nr:spoIIAB 1 [Bacillota bacterium]